MHEKAFAQPTDSVAVCRAGLETAVAGELEALGLSVTRQGARMVSFAGDANAVYLACRGLYSAVSVLRPLRKFRATNYDVLYHQCRKTPWHKLFAQTKQLRIDVKGHSPHFPNSQFTIHRIKDAIVDTFRKLVGERPSMARREPDVRIVAYLYRDEVTLYLDGSGEPLSQRGYRVFHGEAPLKQDLAAGILRLSGWNGQCDFVDPMAGGGTFLAEALLMAADRAPNCDRAMAFQHWADYDTQRDADTKAHLKAREKPVSITLSAYEADAPTFSVLHQTLRENFGLDAFELNKRRFQQATQSHAGAFVVTNPPYGHRLRADTDRLYRELGQFLKDRCAGGTAGVFSANLEALDRLGMKAKARHKLYNGQLEARLAIYDIRN